MHRRVRIAAACAGFVSGGCATAPLDATEIHHAEERIARAEELDAQFSLAAFLELERAESALRLARAHLAQGDEKGARSHATRAAADAEVALALARAAQARRAAAHALRRAAELDAALEKVAPGTARARRREAERGTKR